MTRSVAIGTRQVDLDTGVVTVDGSAERRLTEAERKLLQTLIEASPAVVDRDTLLAAGFGPDEENTRVVDFALRRLRQKVEHDPNRPQHVLTVHGEGYRILLEAPAETARPRAQTGLAFDVQRRELVVDGVSMELTPKEAGVFGMLWRRPGVLVEREDILSEVWGLRAPRAFRYVDQIVYRLRQKLGRHADVIESTTLAGYRLTLSVTRFEAMALAEVDGVDVLWEAVGFRAQDAITVFSATCEQTAKPLEGAAWVADRHRFEAAFQSLHDAGTWAAQTFGALLAAPWPEDVLRVLPAQRVGTQLVSRGPRVRIAIASGALVAPDPTAGRRGFSGLGAARAEALLALTGPGQVVFDGPPASVDVPPEVGLDTVDLGLCVVREGSQPVPLTALQPHGTIRTVEPRRQGNLAAESGGFHGRGPELDLVSAQLAKSPRVTLLGPGGVGKSRLAREWARHADLSQGRPVWVVRPGGASGLLPTLAQALGWVGALPSPAEALERLEAARSVVIVEDAEVAPGEVRDLLDLWGASERLTVLVTSRQRIGYRGEALVPIDPLSDDDALELLVDRVGALGGRIGDPAAWLPLVRALDALPLALELVAHKAARLGPEELLAALDDRFRLARDTQRTGRDASLWATLDWSWATLQDAHKEMLIGLSAFPGGVRRADLAPALGLSPMDALDSVEDLADRSMVRWATGLDGPRVDLLETIRQFTRNQAGSDRARAAEAVMAEWVAGQVAARAGDAAPRWWMAERKNVLACIDVLRALERGPDAAVVLDQASQGLLRTGSADDVTTRIEALTSDKKVRRSVSASLHIRRMEVALLHKDVPQAERLLARDVGAEPLRPLEVVRWEIALGKLAVLQGKSDVALRHLEPALHIAEAEGAAPLAADAALQLAHAHRLAFRRGEAVAVLDRALERIGGPSAEGLGVSLLAMRLSTGIEIDPSGAGPDPTTLADLLGQVEQPAARLSTLRAWADHLSYGTEDPAAAEPVAFEALQLARTLGRTDLQATWFVLARAAWARGDHTAAAERFQAGLDEIDRKGLTAQRNAAWTQAAMFWVDTGDLARVEACVARAVQSGDEGPLAWSYAVRGLACARAGRVDEARADLHRTRPALEGSGVEARTATYCSAAAELLIARASGLPSGPHHELSSPEGVDVLLRRAILRGLPE